MKNTSNSMRSLAATLTTFGLLAEGANAMVILTDTFTRTGNIQTSTTDTGQTWSHPGNTFTTNGTTAQLVSSQTAQISGIPFNTNTIYNLSMDVSLDTSNNFWIGFGFGNQHIDSTAFMIHEQGNAGLFRNNLSGKQTISLTDTDLKNFEIILNTGTTLANSTASYKIDGVTVGNTVNVNATGLDGVFMQLSGTGLEGTVDNFTLTTVPEPSSALLLALGALAAVGRRRRS